MTRRQLLQNAGKATAVVVASPLVQLALREESIEPQTVVFDRWRIDDFKLHAEPEGFCSFATWEAVGQGYKDMSPRLETFEGLLLEGRIRHGGHPLLNMAAANAIAIADPAGNRKLEKFKSTQRIDPIVAAVMAVHQVVNADAPMADASDLIFV
jgi:phage terminase large subunit-like protein